MKIRTVTAFLPGEPTPEGVRTTAILARSVADRLRAVRVAGAGFEVQTLRVALAHWDTGLGRLPEAARAERLRAVTQSCRDNGIDYCAVGPARHPDQIRQMAELLPTDPAVLNGAADCLGPDGRLDRAAVTAATEAIGYLARALPGGLGNFQFAAGFGVRAETPYFPTGFAGARPAFAVGFENGDALVDACRRAASVDRLRDALTGVLEPAYSAVAAAAQTAAEELGVAFGGIDTSIAPSVAPDESLLLGFDALGVPFGSAGTVEVCAAVTDALQSVAVPRCGYCGLMLSVMEDAGLARLAGTPGFDVRTLLVCSAVCGVGVDMIPLAGDVPAERVARLLGDTGAMAAKLRKPLSVRVLPIPGKSAADATDFRDPFLCNSRLFVI